MKGCMDYFQNDTIQKTKKTIAQKGFHNSDQQVKQDKSTLKGKEKEK